MKVWPLASSFTSTVISSAASVLLRDVHISFLDVADHLVIQLLLESCGWLHDPVSVGVFRFQVLRHFGIGLLPEPVVIVHQLATVDVVFSVDLFGDRRSCYCSGDGLVIGLQECAHE